MTKFKTQIIVEFLKTISESGFEAYLIGGCVRDYLVKQKINDIDITTNAPISFLKNAFNVIKSNEQFLNVTILYKHTYLEVTCFRKDKYSNSRFPKVSFVPTIEMDIKRRDFTINCIYMNYEQKITYPLTSQKDLRERKIVCVNDCNISFKQDPLRMLRAINYAIKLNFDISSEVLQAMRNNWHLIDKLSNSRLTTQINEIQKNKNYSNNKYYLEFLI